MIMTYNTELENCLIAIARRYAPHLVPADWHAPGDLDGSLPQFIRQLRGQGVLIVIGDRLGHADEDAVVGAARDCVALYRRLYQYLAARLFPFSYAGTETRAVLCQEDDFVVVGLCAPAGPIVDAIDALIAPFIIRNHAPPLPDRDRVDALAGEVLAFLETNAADRDMIGEIGDMIEALCAMSLRPLPYLSSHIAHAPVTPPEPKRKAVLPGLFTRAQTIDGDESETAPSQPGDLLVGPIPDWAPSV